MKSKKNFDEVWPQIRELVYNNDLTIKERSQILWQIAWTKAIEIAHDEVIDSCETISECRQDLFYEYLLNIRQLNCNENSTLK